MHDSPLLFFTIILVSALAAMASLKALKAPTLPAYFIAGLFVGPNGLGVLHTTESAQFAGELGIVLLLFTIGLKLNLGGLRAIRDFVFLLGALQVALTALLFGGVAWFFLQDALLASLIGFVAAMSSTAIVSQLLLEANAVASPVGRRAIGILILQDLIVIPLLIVYSNPGDGDSLWLTAALLAGKTAAVLAFMLLLAPALMRRWLDWVARYGDRELFIVNIVGVLSLCSMLTGLLGLSYVLGAFLAGILIAETYHRHRVEQIVEPFRQLFLGFFFVTLGAQIDPHLLPQNAGKIALLTLALLALKTPLVFLCARAVKTHNVTAFRAAMLIGGAGEFGFVLLEVADNSGVLPNELFQVLVPVNVLAMIAVPLLWGQSDKWARALFPSDWLSNARRITKNLAKTQRLRGHVIICGFGRTGQAVAGILRALGSRDYVAMDEDYIIMRAAQDAERVIYGSGDRSDSLLGAGVLRARALVVTYTDPVAAALTVQTARKLNSELLIVCKAVSAQQAKTLQEAGADEALTDAHETGFSLAERSLRRLGEEPWMLRHALENARRGKNRLFLAQYAGTTDTEDDKLLMGHFVTANVGDLQAGRLPAGVEVVAWRRAGGEMSPDDADTVFEAGDQLVLLGDAAAIAEAKAQLSD